MSYAVNENGQQMRFTEDELAILQATFGGNEKLLKLMRKVFLPPYDPEAPLNQTIDLWLAATDLKQMTPDVAYQHIMARNMLMGHVEAQLEQIRFLAQTKETPAETAAKEKKNDTR